MLGLTDRSEGSTEVKTGIARTSWWTTAGRAVASQSAWLLLVLVGIAASFLNGNFLSLTNMYNILGTASPLGLLVMAQSVVLITANLDLSTEANLIFSAVVAGALIDNDHWPWVLGLGALIVTSVCVGLVNGFFIVILRMNAFMVTLGMLTLLGGLSLGVSGSLEFSVFSPSFLYIGGGVLGNGLPFSAVFLLVVFGAMHVLLKKTVLGRSFYAIGSNRRAARNAGVRDSRALVKAYVLSGLLSGLAGFVLMGRLGVASADMSSGQLFLSIAAAVIGGVSLFGGVGSVVGMLGGLLLMTTITDAMNLASFPPDDIQVVTGAVIIVAVLIDALRRPDFPALRALLKRLKFTSAGREGFQGRGAA